VYALGRIAVEGYRGDAGRGIYLGLSSGQIFSFAVLAAIACGLLARRLRPMPAIAAAAFAVLLIAPRSADAQSPAPVAAPQAAPAPVPAQAPPPVPAPPQAAYSAPMAPLPAPVPGGDASPAMLHAGALLGVATPFNRRPEQVATLGGPSLSLGLALARFGIWLDLDSLGNRDASHGTVLLSGGMTTVVANRLHIGGRIGVGATLVNFDEPAFRDVAGTTVRFEALVDYRLGDSWALWLRPLTFDTLAAADLGGPITTWQLRIGLGYRFAVGRKRTPAHPPPPYPPSPYQPYPPPPYPQQPYPQQPYQPYPAQPYPPQPYPAQPYPAQPYPPPPPYQPGQQQPAPQPYPPPPPYQPGQQQPAPQPYPAPPPYQPGQQQPASQPYPTPPPYQPGQQQPAPPKPRSR
jgi:hypothetical protein